MSMKKMAAALTAAVVLGISATTAVGNLPVMAAAQTAADTAESDVSVDNSDNNAEKPDEVTYTLKIGNVTISDDDGKEYPRGRTINNSDGSITIFVSDPQPYLTVSLTGTASPDEGATTVEVTAEPIRVAIGSTFGTFCTFESADGSVVLVKEIFLKEQPKVTLSDISAVIKDESGADVPYKKIEGGNDYINITVPHNTADGYVTVDLKVGKKTIEYKSTGEIFNYTDFSGDPVTAEIGNDRGSNYSLKSADGQTTGGKLFVLRAEDPDTSDPDTSDPDTSDPDTSDSDTSDPDTSDPDTSDPVKDEPATSFPEPDGTAVSKPATSVPASSENEFKPVLPDTGLNEEQNRVLGGISITVSKGVFDDGVVMNAKPGQTKNGFSFDITFTKNGKEVQPNGSVSVKVPVPETLKGKTVFVFHVENGRFVLISSEIKDGFVVFTANHFSEYVLSTENLADTGYVESSESTSVPESKPTAPESGNPNTGMAAAAFPVLLTASAAAVIIAKKKK